MKSLLILTLLLLIPFISFVHSQSRGRAPKSGGSIDASKPTVYLKYEKKVVVRNPPEPAEENLLLSLRNNSKWSILINTTGGQNQSLHDISVFYDVLDKDERIVSRHQCHVCSVNSIRPGQSIRFLVPTSELSDRLSIRLGFSFMWENPLFVASGEEPTHYVFFSSLDVPPPPPTWGTRKNQ